MKSLFIENRVEISNYSIIDGAKEIVKVQNQMMMSINNNNNINPNNANLSPQISNVNGQNDDFIEKTLSDINLSPSL